MALSEFAAGRWEAWDVHIAALFLPQLICGIRACVSSYSDYMLDYMNVNRCFDEVLERARGIFMQSVLTSRSQPGGSALALVPPELLRLTLGQHALFCNLYNLGVGGTVGTTMGPNHGKMPRTVPDVWLGSARVMWTKYP